MEKRSVGLIILLWVEIIAAARVLLFTVPVMISSSRGRSLPGVGYSPELIVYLSLMALAHLIAGLVAAAGEKTWKLSHYGATALTWVLTALWIKQVAATGSTAGLADMLPALISTGLTIGVLSLKGNGQAQKKWRSVLIVDDDETLLKTVRPILISNGYSVLTAESGEDGIHVATSQLPDLIILDVILPGVKGRDVCKSLKQNNKTKHIPIIFLTSKDSPDDIRAEMAIGAAAHLTKPVDPKALVSTVRQVLQ